MIDTQVDIKNLILEEICIRKYVSFTQKECNIMFNNLNVKYKITKNEFNDALKCLVSEKLLLICSSDFSVRHYELSNELKDKLRIE